MCLVIVYAFVVVCPLTFFFKISFISKKSFKNRNTIRVSNGLDPDQDRRSVGPDLDPSSQQRLSAGDKSFEALLLIFHKNVDVLFASHN